MGIEGEQLVYDYLSRVGDLAHGTSMSAADRARLVNRLRNEIGQRRAAAGGAESRAEVKRILGGFGSPEDVVAAAAESGADSGAGAGTAGVAQRPASTLPPEPTPASKLRSKWRFEPKRKPQPKGEPKAGPKTGPKTGPKGEPKGAPEAEAEPGSEPGASAPVPPQRASARTPRDDEALDLAPGARLGDPHWPDGRIGGFVGGLDPDFLGPRAAKPPTEAADADPADVADAADVDVDPEAGEEPAPAPAPSQARPAAPARRARWQPRLRKVLSGRRVGGPFELLAVALLGFGSVVGSLYPMILGWLIAYWAPRLSRTEAQWATFGMPAIVAGGYALWLAGRANGQWGETLPEDAVGQAFSDHWPELLRVAAFVSAAFLLWRARRPRP